MSSKSQLIDSQAADWATKRNLRALTPEEQAAFDAWLAADICHLGAYGRAEAVLARLERASSNAIGDVAGHHAEVDPDRNRRRVVLMGGIAASVAAVVSVGSFLWRNLDGDYTINEATFATGIGQTREVLLADGSVITLNTNSSVWVRLSKNTREIYLAKGEALFDVAKDKNRPFIVRAGDALVRAVGTSFTVSVLPRRPLEVLVREGVVELKRPDTSAVLVGACTRALAPRNAPIVAEPISTTKLARDLAWQYGQIAFDNKTLQEAADEFARYGGARIIVDAAVANKTVTGLFASNNPIAFAKAAGSVLKLHVSVTDSEVRIGEGKV